MQWATSSVAGILATLLALGASEAYAGLTGGHPSLIESAGTHVINMVPSELVTFAISELGPHSKLVLVISLLIFTAIAGVPVGLLGARSWPMATLGFVSFGVLAGVSSTLGMQSAPGHAAVSAAIFTGTALVTLRWLTHTIPLPHNHAQTLSASAWHPSRRRFITRSALVTLVAAFVGIGGRGLIERTRSFSSQRDDAVLPPPRMTAKTPSQLTTTSLSDMPPIVTPLTDFYRIDTAVAIPRINTDDWKLRITGLVDRAHSITYKDLLQMATEEVHITLCCVSNEIGGHLIGNAKWQGVPLADVLNHAGVQKEAAQVVGRSTDNFSAGFPIDAAFDGRPALIAVGMNGEPLPLKHGFPARLIVSGLYGYVSATKWLNEIQLTTWEGYDGYWIPRGWSKMGSVKTHSRIDVPKPIPTSVSPGNQFIAGLAWAQNRGITKVEVKVDDDDWQQAQLLDPISKHTWVQWILKWEANAGLHSIAVRATDRNGDLQPEGPQRPPPDGAEGWHRINVRVVGQ